MTADVYFSQVLDLWKGFLSINIIISRHEYTNVGGWGEEVAQNRASAAGWAVWRRVFPLLTCFTS